MSLRLGVDMDGTIADLSSAYHDVERALFGDREVASDDAAEADDREEPGEIEGKAALKAARHASRERDQVWEAIRQTEDFWLGLRPIEPGIVRRLYEASIANGWEVFFITQRPRTMGLTVQRQTQQWLIREGFETPSVLTLTGGRGRAAAALELDVLLDDHPKNCVDVRSDSKCRPILVLRSPSPTAEAAARHVGIEVVRSVAEALPLLEAPSRPGRPGFFSRMFRS